MKSQAAAQVFSGQEETYYEVLKVPRTATVSEIVAAYHTARGAFSRESMATYSLFSPEETQAIIERLDEAYHTLANIEKKRDYDRYLEMKDQNMDVPSLSELSMGRRSELVHGKEAGESTQGDFTPLPSGWNGDFSGALLKFIREQRGLSVDEISKTTKIPAKYLKAIESDDVKHLPARVYLQGFVKNLATVFRLDPRLVTKGYLDYTDRNGNSPTDPSA